MPQPSLLQVHVAQALTQIATAYVQDERHYVADDVFSVIPVEFQSDKIWQFSKSDFLRDEAQLRADSTESAGGGFNTVATLTYNANVWAFHKDLGEQTRKNQDPALNLDVSIVRYLMQKMLIRRDRFFMSQFVKSSVWATDVTGTAGGTPGSSTPAFWNDDANSDPFTDIQTGITTILQNTGFEPNVLLLSYPAYAALRKHPLVVDRIKYGGRFGEAATARSITPELMAAAFDVERVVVSKAVYDTSAENAASVMGAADTFSFVASKDALLVHRPPNPGLFVPSAGYIFAWAGFTNENTMGIRINQIPLPWLGLGTVRTEAEMAFDMITIGTDLGYHFSGIVQ